MLLREQIFEQAVVFDGHRRYYIKDINQKNGIIYLVDLDAQHGDYNRDKEINIYFLIHDFNYVGELKHFQKY